MFETKYNLIIIFIIKFKFISVNEKRRKNIEE
jgi:hypothetical protein